jgi:hypothetical protein
MLLVVTGQTVDRCLALLVARNTPAHRERRHLLDDLHVGDVTVARVTADPGAYMSLVCKSHVRRKAVDAYPRDRTLVLGVCQDSLDFRVPWQHDVVTPRTASDRWESRHRSAPRIRMTELTIQSDVGHMQTMTEDDRL